MQLADMLVEMGFDCFAAAKAAAAGLRSTFPYLYSRRTRFSRNSACVLLMMNPVCKPGQEGESRIAEALDWLERHSEDPSVSEPPPTPKTKEAPEILTIDLPLSLPITPAISLSPSREDKSGDQFVHFQVDFNFNGPFEYAPSHHPHSKVGVSDRMFQVRCSSRLQTFGAVLASAQIVPLCLNL